MASMAIPTDASSMAGGVAQSPVLRVIVENLFYPVTLDVLHQVLPLWPYLKIYLSLLKICMSLDYWNTILNSDLGSNIILRLFALYFLITRLFILTETKSILFPPSY